MKLSVLLVLVSIPFLPRSNALLYYVSSEHIDNHTCTTSGSTALRPCVSFDDLSSNKTFLSNKASVKLLLLSKNYFVSQNLTAKNIRKLEIFPSGQWEEVSVECEPAVQLYFHTAVGLRMRSLSFTSCTLRYLQGHSNLSTLTVDSCLFSKNTLNYAINVINHYSLNISINNCTFSSNRGALSVDGSRWSFGLPLSFPINTNLLVTDSVFSDNWRNGFNWDSGFGGTSIYARDVSISIYRSQFLNNSAESGGAIGTAHGRGSLEIYDCLFSNNSARTGNGRAIKLFTPDSLVLNNCNFKYNFAAKSGGAIYSEVMDCYSCLFENNSAKLLGGAIYTSTANNDRDHKISIANFTFHFNEAGLDGGAVYCQKYPRKMDWLVISQTYSKSNSAARGGFLYLSDCHVSMVHKTSITESQAEHGGAIYSQDSRIAVESSFIVPIPGILLTGFRYQLTTVMLANNVAKNGGALFLVDSSVNVGLTSNLIFDHNVANRGGAIYVLDNKCEIKTNSSKIMFLEFL